MVLQPLPRVYGRFPQAFYLIPFGLLQSKQKRDRDLRTTCSGFLQSKYEALWVATTEKAPTAAPLLSTYPSRLSPQLNLGGREI